MDRPLFDPARLNRNRRRAAHGGSDLFLHARALDGLLDDADGHALPGPVALVGIPAGLQDRFAPDALAVMTLGDLDALPGHYGTIAMLGELGTADQPAALLAALRHLLRPGGTLAGCIVGGASLQRLHGALLDADRMTGRAARRIHPFLDGSTLAGLLQSAGFDRPVVAIDRVEIAYRSLDRLVADVRTMGCGAALADPGPPLTRSQFIRARAAFLGDEERVIERFDLVHYTARAPA